MTRYFNRAFLTAALGAVALDACISTGPAAAAPPACAPGLENVAGACVNRGLAAAMTERSVLMNQLKLGYNLPIAPRKDDLYPRNFDVNRFEFSHEGNFSTNPNPQSP